MPSQSRRSRRSRLSIMPNHHLRIAGQLFLFVQLFYVFIQLQIQLEHTHQRRRIESNSASSSWTPLDDSLEALLLVQLHRRRWWKIPRSQHWIQIVLAEEMLHENEFRKTFRMTRNSFNQLHALLGIYILTSWRYIEPYILLTDTRFHLAMPSRICLLVFLFHATQGANYYTISI